MLTQCLKKTPALADPPFNIQDQQIPLLKTTLSKRPCPVPQLSLCPQSLSVLKLRSAEKLETAAHIWTATLTSVNQVPPAKIFIFNPGVYFGLLRAPNWTPHPQQVLNCFLNRRWKFWLRGKKKKLIVLWGWWWWGNLLLLDWRTWGSNHWMNGTSVEWGISEEKQNVHVKSEKTRHFREEKKYFVTSDMALRNYDSSSAPLLPAPLLSSVQRKHSWRGRKKT